MIHNSKIHELLNRKHPKVEIEQVNETSYKFEGPENEVQKAVEGIKKRLKKIMKGIAEFTY